MPSGVGEVGRDRMRLGWECFCRLVCVQDLKASCSQDSVWPGDQ